MPPALQSFATVLPILMGFLLGCGIGAGTVAWLHRDERAETRRRRRRDRVREAIVLARDNLCACYEERALRWARRAVRLDRRNGEAHAALGACLAAVDHYESALHHHQRAEALASAAWDAEERHGADAWRLQNALDALQACVNLRHEVRTEDEAQRLWDEAAAWAHLAHEIRPDEASEALARSPWLVGFSDGGEAWLQP